MKTLIVGAGPGGLSMGYSLKQKGYTDFLILEKLGRVGGMCLSMTYKNRSFDLGANYVTSSYTTIEKMAREVGADLYVEEPGTCYDPYADPPKWSSIMSEATEEDGLFAVGIASAKYLAKRLLIADVVDKPGFAQFQGRPEYLVSFQTWLEANDLSALQTLFSIPITLMGYGNLDEIPAPYALKYMAPGSFEDLLVYGAGVPWPLRQHPKRFVDGFQRFWERVAFDLPVRLNADITNIERRSDGVYVTYSYVEQVQNQLVTRTLRRERYDQLVLACPQEYDILSPMMTLTKTEEQLFRQVIRDPYCLTTYDAPGLALSHPVVNILPIPKKGKPFVLTQQFKDNTLISFYSRMPESHADEQKALPGVAQPNSKAQRAGKKVVLDECIAVLADLPGVSSVPKAEDYITHDEWNYFPHVPVTAFQAGWYTELEAIQGDNRTWYAGGLLAFDLIEPIVEYSDDLADRLLTANGLKD